MAAPVASAPLKTLGKRQQYQLLQSQLDLEYSSFRAQHQDLSENVLPFRGRFFVSDVNKGDRRNLRIIDNTATTAARTASSGMMAGITSPARNWKRLTTPDPKLAEYSRVKEWLNVVDNRMSTYFSKSNLYQVLPTLYLDLINFGTSAMMVEEDLDKVFRFYSFPVGSYRLAKGADGKICVFFREFRMTVRQVVEKFGQRDAAGNMDWSNISLNVQNLYTQGQLEVWVDVCHLIQPNEKWNPYSLKSKLAKNKKYISVYYEKGISGQVNANLNNDMDDRMLRESGYDYFPVLAPRWQVTGEDVYATDCPGMTAIGDIKQLQHGERRGGQALDKIVNPPMKGPTSMKTSKASIISGDITYVDEQQQGQAFTAAHEVRLGLMDLEQKQEAVRARIRKAYYEDMFLMLAESDRRTITATEIDERREEKLLALGPVLEQLNQDVLDPLIEIAFFLMQQQGLIPEAPEELQGQPLKIEYISIMAQAQKLIGVTSIERVFNFTAGVIKMNPASADKVDFDEMIDAYAEAVGVSPEIIRDDEETAAIREAHQQQMAAQQKSEQIAALSQSAKNLAQSPTDGDNALTRLMQAAKAGELAPNG